MQKRGQVIHYELIVLITIVVGLIVGGVYIYRSNSLSTGKTTLKVAASRDIALILDTIYAYPYDIELEYNIDLSKFIVEISENSVKIYDASLVKIGKENKIIGKDMIFAQYSFSPVNDEPNFIFDKPKKLIFKKEENKLEITPIK